MLTPKQAMAAMVLFLDQYYKETNSDDVASLLSELLFLSDGSTTDPASWHKWMRAVRTVLDAAQTTETWERFEQEWLTLRLTREDQHS